MKLRNLLLVAACATTLAACGSNNGSSNNGSSNNGGTNNGSSNNGSSNNGSNAGSNNGASNNGATNNNGVTNNNGTTTGTNNGTTAGTNNGTTTATNNGTTTGTNNGTTTGTNNGTTGGTQTCNGSLDAATACGGDPMGTWTVDEVCSDYDFAGLIQQACAQATAGDPTVDATGTLAVTASNWAYELNGSAMIDANIPQNCNFLGCAQTASLIESTGGAESATCTDDGAGGCDCTATYDISTASAGSYTTDGAGTATIGTGETYYYCVAGDSIQIREYGTQNDDAQPTTLLIK